MSGSFGSLRDYDASIHHEPLQSVHPLNPYHSLS